MSCWSLITMQEERYQDLLREAKNERMVRRASVNRAIRPGLLLRALVCLIHR